VAPRHATELARVRAPDRLEALEGGRRTTEQRLVEADGGGLAIHGFEPCQETELEAGATPLDLFLGDRLLAHAFELAIDHGEQLLGPAPFARGREELDQPRVLERADERAHVARDLELPDQALMQAARAAAEQHLDEQGEDRMVVVTEGRAVITDDGLFGGSGLRD